MSGVRAAGRGARALAVFTAGLAACTPHADARLFGTPAPTPTAVTIVGRMGVAMPESAARHGIAFQPFAPPRQIVAVALLPAFHGADDRTGRGIGFEYSDSSGRRYALAQWPANGGTIARFAPFAESEPGCAAARMFPRGTRPNGIVWSTPQGLIMTLQPDGANDAQTLRAEWRKLIRRGVCR